MWQDILAWAVQLADNALTGLALTGLALMGLAWHAIGSEWRTRDETGGHDETKKASASHSTIWNEQKPDTCNLSVSP